jgi:hypothetical protein
MKTHRYRRLDAKRALKYSHAKISSFVALEQSLFLPAIDWNCYDLVVDLQQDLLIECFYEAREADDTIDF